MSASRGPPPRPASHPEPPQPAHEDQPQEEVSRSGALGSQLGNASSEEDDDVVLPAEHAEGDEEDVGNGDSGGGGGGGGDDEEPSAAADSAPSSSSTSPQLPERPFPSTEATAAAIAAAAFAEEARADDDDDDDADEEEEEGDTYADDTMGRPRGARIGGRGGSGAFDANEDGVSSNEEGLNESDEEENSMIMHASVGHRHGASFSTVDFNSPPAPHINNHALSPPGDHHPSYHHLSFRHATSPPGSAAAAAAAASSSSAASALSPDSSIHHKYVVDPHHQHQHHANDNGTPNSSATREDLGVIDHYIRQAMHAKDYAAMNDLVARANDQHLSSDLISHARTVLQDKRAEDRDNEVATLKHYMRASIDARSRDACMDVLKKVEPLAQSIPQAQKYTKFSDFFLLMAECQAAVDELEREDAQTVNSYLKQGQQLRSREVLQAALTKATSVRHSLLDQSVLLQAKQLLTELDSQVMLRNFLTLAIKNRDLVALEESIAQAAKLHLSERDAPELAEARRLADDLKSHVGSSSAGMGGNGSMGSLSKFLQARQREEAKKMKEKEKEREKEREKIAKDARHAAEKAAKNQKRAEKEARHTAEKKEKHEQAAAAAAAAQQQSSGAGVQKDSKPKWPFGNLNKDKKKDGSLSSSSTGVSGRAKLFGGSLHEAMRRNPSLSGVPKVVEDAARFLRGAAMQEPGLFRVAGNKELIDNLRAAYEEAYQGDESQPAPPLTEIHDASGLFKLYFRLLPEPLIPYEFYNQFVKIGLNKGPERVAQLKELVATLPSDNFVMLDWLFTFLLDVSHHSSVNMMSPSNLAIVFAPNLIRPKVETPQSMMTEMPSSISVIASFISDHDVIFGAGGDKEAGAASKAAGAGQ